jgi:hypothetical protein
MSTLYGYPESDRYTITKDGGPALFSGTEAECWSWLHQNTSSSVFWALSYEGYKMEPSK